MADLMQQARELLNAARARLGVTPRSSLLAQEAAAWEAIAAALRAAPEGFVLVPVEPTDEMIKAGCVASNAQDMYLRNDTRMLRVWSAMISASQQVVK